MQNPVHRTYFTAVELESGRVATLLIRFQQEVIIARLKSADEEHDVLLARDDGQDFRSRTVQALLFHVASGFERFRRVRYSHLPYVYSVDAVVGNAEVKTSAQTLH